LVILRKIGHPRYAYFISKFVDREPLAVAQAFGEIKQKSGIPILCGLLESPNESVRWTGSHSLIQIKGERVVDSVRLRLRHPNQDVIALAARTLGMLGVADGLRTRSLAIAYLGQLKDPKSRAIFVAGLKDKSLMVRAYSFYALGFIGKTSDMPTIEVSLAESKKITYFSEDEDQAMLAEFWEFDRKMIHEKYKAVVEGLEESE
jgi:HEAT repeat protein